MLCTITSHYLTLISASRIKPKWRVKATQDSLYHTKQYILFSCFIQTNPVGQHELVKNIYTIINIVQFCFTRSNCFFITKALDYFLRYQSVEYSRIPLVFPDIQRFRTIVDPVLLLYSPMRSVLLFLFKRNNESPRVLFNHGSFLNLINILYLNCDVLCIRYFRLYTDLYPICPLTLILLVPT